MNRLAQDLHDRMSVRSTFERAFRMAAMDVHTADGRNWQLEYLEDEDDILGMKGRQIGASTCAAAKVIHIARYEPGSLSVIVSPSQKQSQEITIRCKAGIRNIERLPLAQDSASIIQLANGSRIMSLPGTATSVRGYTARLLVVDEAAYVDEETWIAARALVATGGQVIVQSTPAGAAGWFYDLWMDRSQKWSRYRVRSDEVPTIDPAFLAREKLSMGDYAYKAEYGAEFLEAGAGLFSAESLRLMVDPEARPYF